jgi:hypothetical protein
MANPTILTAAGQEYTNACRVMAVVWVGTTVVADKAVLTCRASGQRLWKGQANDTNTYLGANFGPDGHSCPQGFRLSQLDDATSEVYVYTRES